MKWFCKKRKMTTAESVNAVCDSLDAALGKHGCKYSAKYVMLVDRESGDETCRKSQLQLLFASVEAGKEFAEQVRSELHMKVRTAQNQYGYYCIFDFDK